MRQWPAINCCRKEFAEVCEIRVCEDFPASLNPGLYHRLRFGLLASSWLPNPLGIFLWSALHVMLFIVGGPIFWVLELLTAFLFFSVFLFGMSEICLFLAIVMYGWMFVAYDLVVFLGQSIRFCWSLVTCHEPTVDWWSECLSVELWKIFKFAVRGIFRALVPLGVPCMSGSLYERTKDRQLKTWARWCDEVVHMHDAIIL